MRIITGTAKGIQLATLEGDTTRPTSERAKEAIFSAIQFDLEGRRTLDLFAGSGQLGLEALSRGAESAMFIDASPEAMAVIKDNAKRTKLFDRSRFLISDYRSYIRKAGGKETFGLILIDPPYGLRCVGDALERILHAGIASPGCLLVCESGDEDIFVAKAYLSRHFDEIKRAKYGVSYIRILQYKGDVGHGEAL